MNSPIAAQSGTRSSKLQIWQSSGQSGAFFEHYTPSTHGIQRPNFGYRTILRNICWAFLRPKPLCKNIEIHHSRPIRIILKNWESETVICHFAKQFGLVSPIIKFLMSKLIKICIAWSKLRSLRMWIIRRVHGLQFVHPTFHCLNGNAISSDFRTGAYSYLGRRCWICPRVTVGKYVMFASEVLILGGDHRFNLPGIPMMCSGRPEIPPTFIEDDVWIGYRVVIMAGVQLVEGLLSPHSPWSQKMYRPTRLWVESPLW